MLIHSEKIVSEYNPDVYKILEIHQTGPTLYEVRITEYYPVREPWVREPSEFTLIDGVARWTSNNSVLRDDVIRDNRIDKLSNFVKSVHEATYARELDAFLTAYCAADPEPDEEIKAEARAAGTKVLVNVVTGRRTYL